MSQENLHLIPELSTPSPPPPGQNNNNNIDISSADSSSEEEEEEGPPLNIVPLDIIMPDPAPVSGGQLSSVGQYNGNPGLEGLVYAESVDRAKTTFNWTEGQTAVAAITRGGNSVANWIRGEKAAGINYNAWNMANPGNNDKNLRAAFLLRFGPKYTTGGAVAAISDLKQRSGETVGGFMDRVKIAVDMLHYNVTEANRNQAFRESYTRLVIAQFGGGVSEDIRERVFGVAEPPNTIEGVLTAASAIENEKHSRASKLVVHLVEDNGATAAPVAAEPEKEKPGPEAQSLEDLQKQMSEVLAIAKRASYPSGRGRGMEPRSYQTYRCYGCGSMGHIREQCTAPTQNPFQNRGRGRGAAPHMTRRGAFRSNFGRGRGRPLFSVGEDHQYPQSHEEPPQEQAQDWAVEEDEWPDSFYEYDDWENNPGTWSGNDPWGRY